MWRVVPLLLLLASLVMAGPHSHTSAKGSSVVSVKPDSGHLGTTIELSSDYWTPNTAVSIYAAYAPTNTSPPPPSSFVGPIATARSNAQSLQYGKWSVRLRLDSIRELSVPGRPGFVVFRAVSDTRLPFSEAGSTEENYEGNFALEVAGKRPVGAGEIDLTVSVADGFVDEEPFLLAMRNSDTAYFSAFPYSTNYFAPYEQTFSRLADGTWDVLVLPRSGREVLDNGSVTEVSGRLCLYPLTQVDGSCELSDVCMPLTAPYCHGHTDTFLAKQVEITHGSTENVEIVLGAPGSVATAPSGDRGWLRTLFIGMAIAAGALALLVGPLVWRRARHAS